MKQFIRDFIEWFKTESAFVKGSSLRRSSGSRGYNPPGLQPSRKVTEKEIAKMAKENQEYLKSLKE